MANPLPQRAAALLDCAPIRVIHAGMFLVDGCIINTMAGVDMAEAGRLVADRYRLVNQLGSGAHGEVWLAEDIELHPQVALKRVHTDDPRPLAERERTLRREARMLAQLNHPNAVTVHNIVVDSGELWLVMEYVPAGSLADLGPVPLQRAAFLAAQLVDVLVAMQRRGMLHCDIKPSNVLLAEDDLVKLSDFGLSRLPDGTFTLPRDRQLVGTPAFMAPEVASHDSEPTSASDVFSLGATIYALIEGHSPYSEADNSRPMLQLAARGVIVEPRQAGRLTALLTGMLARDPQQRLTAGEVKNKLTTLGFGQKRPGLPPGSLWRALWPLPRRHVRTVIAAAAVVVVIAVVVAIASLLPSATPGAAGPNQQMADPCGLTDAAAVGRFGQIEKSDDDGNFNRCDLHVTTADADVDVKVELNTPAGAPGGPGVPEGQVTHPGGLTVVAEPLNDGQCDRAVVLPDQNQVDIAAQTKPGQSTANLCPIADATTDSAVHTLTASGLPSRGSLPLSSSWFYSNACRIVDANALNQFPGVDALHPDVGFNNWECDWHSTTTSARLLVRFDRNDRPASAADGQPIQVAGHSAFVAQNDYAPNSCEVIVEGRQYADNKAQLTEERLLVVIIGPQPMNQMCDQSVAIAQSATAKLPA